MVSLLIGVQIGYDATRLVTQVCPRGVKACLLDHDHGAFEGVEGVGNNRPLCQKGDERYGQICQPLVIIWRTEIENLREKQKDFNETKNTRR